MKTLILAAAAAASLLSFAPAAQATFHPYEGTVTFDFFELGLSGNNGVSPIAPTTQPSATSFQWVLKHGSTADFDAPSFAFEFLGGQSNNFGMGMVEWNTTNYRIQGLSILYDVDPFGPSANDPGDFGLPTVGFLLGTLANVTATVADVLMGADFAAYLGIVSGGAFPAAGELLGAAIFDVQKVPAPAALPLLALGVAGLVAARRRKAAA